MEELTGSLISFKPTPNEREASNYLFKKADSDHLGVLTGDKAVMFFNHAGLPPVILGEIWEATDPENTGFLTPERFGVACRLIGHAQSSPGSEVKSDWIGTPATFPKFEGYPIPAHLIPSTPSVISSPPRASVQQLQPQPTGSFNASLNNNGSNVRGTAGISISQDEKVRYSKLFMGSGPVGGLLDGDKARDIFIKSKLPYDKLGQIWNLADTHSRGSLDVADFTIGMHLIQHTMNNDLPSLPAVLSPALYASAVSMNAAAPTSPAMANRSRMSVGGNVGSPLRAGSMSSNAGSSGFISPQSTGQQRQSFVQNPYTSQTMSYPQQQQLQQQQAWDIDAKEKSESDSYFDGLDSMRSGTIEGEAAVGFFSQSGLDIGVLARVWDLADIRGSGALNKDEFAVALRLIRDKVAGKELPAVLPLSMTPPSLRTQSPPAPQRDLLDLLDDEPTPLSPLAPTTSSMFPQNTGGSTSRLAPQSTGTSAYSQSALQGTIFPQATGATNRSITPQATGFAGNFAAAPAPVVQGSNFFEDNDIADQQSKLASDQANLATLEAEHSAAAAAVTTLAARRAELEASLSSTTSSINELQVSLAQARAAHETERGMVDSLESRHKEQADLLARARHELITAESDLSALRVERTEIEGNYLRDKEDVREMNKKMAEVTLETNKLKEVLEKLKKDARQQKGLVAISKKQLLTAEGEKEKVASSIVEEENRPVEVEEEVVLVVESSPFDHVTSSPIASSPFDHHPLSNAATASQFPLPISPVVASPSGSTRSTNPFERMTSSLHQVIIPEPETQPTSKSEAETSHSPLASLSAVGLGAAAVIGAAGATVAGVLGFGHEKKEEEQKKEAEEKIEEPVVGTEEPRVVQEEVAEPVATPASAQNEKEQVVEGDPFAIDDAGASPISPESTSDQGFGDDFTASPVVLSHELAPSTSTFDKDFEDFDTPISEPLPVSEEPSAAPVHSFVETREPASEAPSSTTTPVEHTEEAVEEEEDSSDDDDEIEDATASGRPTASTSGKTSEVALSDSGESFVHVPSVTNETETEPESKFPALESLEIPAVATAAAVVVPTVLSDSNVMAGARSASPVPQLETLDTSASTIFDEPMTRSISLEPPPTPTKELVPAIKKRAAPPPPPTRNSLSSSQSPVASSSSFDDAFSSSNFTPAPVASMDDFDDAFSDLPPPTSVVAGAGGGRSSMSSIDNDTNDFDTFDDEFSFKPDFNNKSNHLGASTSSSTSAFDDSFANFDSAFDPTSSTSTTLNSSTTPKPSNNESAFSFDDAFGSDSPITTTSKSTSGLPDYLAASTPIPAVVPPALPARDTTPATTPALDNLNDVEGVRTIVGMGFTKAQALTSLMKYDYDVSRALNSLLE